MVDGPKYNIYKKDLFNQYFKVDNEFDDIQKMEHLRYKGFIIASFSELNTILGPPRIIEHHSPISPDITYIWLIIELKQNELFQLDLRFSKNSYFSWNEEMWNEFTPNVQYNWVIQNTSRKSDSLLSFLGTMNDELLNIRRNLNFL